MKQVAQKLSSGEIAVAEVPVPTLRGPGVLLATEFSVLSPGTERAAVELGRSSLLGKALRRPDQVRKLLATMRREGLVSTLRKVQGQLDADRPMGYSCAGIVLETHDSPFAPGERVACAGTDAATHAEINFVPRNLCARVPESVAPDEAAFAALGAIALHALRLGEAALGEEVAVIGLGVLGLLLAQVLRAAGCRVTGFDVRADRLAAAEQLALHHVSAPQHFAAGGGAATNRRAGNFDRVFLCAASRSAEPVEFAVQVARDRARIIVVGDVRTDFPRNDCYEKELSVVFARSYGPGRYDPSYEEQGIDYPRAYLPWTVQRNLEAFLGLLAEGRVSVAPLITHRLPIEEAGRAYEIVSGAEASLGVVLEYPAVKSHKLSATIGLRPMQPRRAGTLGVGFIGAGSYAATSLLPHLAADPRVRLAQVANARGLSAKRIAEKFRFSACTTDSSALLSDSECDAVFIAARHSLHARLVQAALEAGKAVYVEKPLCVSLEELDRLEAVWRRTAGVPVMVGFNRRFAPATRAIAEFFQSQAAQPASVRYTVHAGPLPAEHWLRDPAEGGRIAGEVCHFVDWCCMLAGAPVQRVYASLRGSHADPTLQATLEFANGSQAAITYEPSTLPGIAKERIEISRGPLSAIVEDFSDSTFFSPQGRKRRTFRGKGQQQMMSAAVDGFLTGHPAYSFAEAVASTRATLLLLDSSSTGLPSLV